MLLPGRGRAARAPQGLRRPGRALPHALLVVLRPIGFHCRGREDRAHALRQRVPREMDAWDRRISRTQRGAVLGRDRRGERPVLLSHSAARAISTSRNGQRRDAGSVARTGARPAVDFSAPSSTTLPGGDAGAAPGDQGHRTAAKIELYKRSTCRRCRFRRADQSSTWRAWPGRPRLHRQRLRQRSDDAVAGGRLTLPGAHGTLRARGLVPPATSASSWAKTSCEVLARSER